MPNGVPDDEDLSDDEYDTFKHLEKLPKLRVSGTLSTLEDSVYKQKAKKGAVLHELVERSLLKITDEKKDPSYHIIPNPNYNSKLEDKPLSNISQNNKLGNYKQDKRDENNLMFESRNIEKKKGGKSKKRKSKKQKHKKTRRHKKMSRYYKTK